MEEEEKEEEGEEILLWAIEYFLHCPHYENPFESDHLGGLARKNAHTEREMRVQERRKKGKQQEDRWMVKNGFSIQI